MPAQNDIVAIKVRGIAAENRVSQQTIADALGVSRVLISNRLTAKTTFTADELIALSKFFSVPVATFFGEAAA
jgi:transcriptional regulator with XRE-family HTH domain